MIRCDLKRLVRLEDGRPGFIATLLRFENQPIPPCSYCGSPDTAAVQCGFVGFSMALAGASTKFHLLPNYNGEGIYFCNSCRRQFGSEAFKHDTGED